MRIDVNFIARKVEVDNRIPLRNYYRIADNLLRQASIYREEKNVVDLYIILLRYSSLVSETIPYHQDYQALLSKERASYRKRLHAVVNELEYLKPEFQPRDELDKAHVGAQPHELDGSETTKYGSEASSMDWPSVNNNTYSSMSIKKPGSMAPQPSWKYNSNQTQGSSSNSVPIDKQFEKLSFGLPLPKKETLSRHSILGPEALRGQWLGPSAEIKVYYPSNTDLAATENLGLNQAGQYGIVAVEDGNLEGARSKMESVLSLDDGRWLRPVEDPRIPLANEAGEDPFQSVSIRQPSPPPVLAQVQQDFAPIRPSKVVDPRPGPAIPSLDGKQSTNSYQHLHVPVHMMEDFLRLAQENTRKNLETCGVLAGSLCQTLNEEDIFEVQDRMSLFPLGWIHTHPSQTCFMSSVDLHTHYSYQIMLPESVAIVMAPTDTSSPHGIFHLSDPAGVSVIRNCQQRGFHPHEEPLDGNPIYEHCSHVFMNPKLKCDVIDLR